MRCSKCSEYIPDGLGLTTCPSCDVDLTKEPPVDKIIENKVEKTISKEKKASKKEAVSEDIKKKKAPLFLMGLLICIGGSFFNGILVRTDVGGLIRELSRLVIFVGLFLMVVAFFRKFWRLILIIFIIGVSALAITNWSRVRQEKAQKIPEKSFILDSTKGTIHKTVEVIDGKTLKLEDGSVVELAGIEIKSPAHDEEASFFMRVMITTGESVRIEFDGESAYVYVLLITEEPLKGMERFERLGILRKLDNSYRYELFFNAALLNEGHAKLDTSAPKLKQYSLLKRATK